MKTVKYSFDPGPLLSYLNNLNFVSLSSIYVESKHVSQTNNNFLRTTGSSNSISINFYKSNTELEKSSSFRFNGFPIFDDIGLTLDVSSFTFDHHFENRNSSFFSLEIFQEIKEIGVYTLFIKYLETDLEIDTSLYIELKNGNILFFIDDHDRKFNQFYFFNALDIEKLDIFKSFFYEESRFVEWEKKVIKSFK